MLYAVQALGVVACEFELAWGGSKEGGVEVRGDGRFRGGRRGGAGREGEERDAYLLLLFEPTWRRGREEMTEGVKEKEKRRLLVRANLVRHRLTRLGTHTRTT